MSMNMPIGDRCKDCGAWGHYCCAAATYAVYPAPAISYGAIVPPSLWCGVHHAHGPHTWVQSSGFYGSCPGSTCGCDDAQAEPVGDGS